MYIVMLCIIYYNTCIFNTVLYTIMCMISINNNNNYYIYIEDMPTCMACIQHFTRNSCISTSNLFSVNNYHVFQISEPLDIYIYI